jgi:hypothetical protein
VVISSRACDFEDGGTIFARDFCINLEVAVSHTQKSFLRSGDFKSEARDASVRSFNATFLLVG